MCFNACANILVFWIVCELNITKVKETLYENFVTITRGIKIIPTYNRIKTFKYKIEKEEGGA